MTLDVESKPRLKVVHITESFASGTLEAMRRMIWAQTADGTQVSVLHGVRPDSPPEEDWNALFPPSVVRTHVKAKNRILALWSIAQTASECLNDDPSVVVHVHSTFAAAAVRLRLAFRRPNRRILYSPHGFAFLRQDLPKPARAGIRLLERLLARQCGGLMLVSQSEAELVKGWLDKKRVVVVENAVDLDEMTPGQYDVIGSGLPVVVTMGRVTYQKAPWKFAELARSLQAKADFVWIGDGPSKDRSRWLSDAPVRVTGWLPRSDVVAQLQAGSVFVLPSLWEGMPLALIEAQCLGLPAVASNVIGNRDVILNEETGYVANTDEDFLRQVESLVDDDRLRIRMNAAALDQRRRFDQTRLGHETLDIYERLLNEG